MGSSAVPEPVVVCRRRSQLLLSYAVRLSMHATSAERVIFTSHEAIVGLHHCVS